MVCPPIPAIGIRPGTDPTQTAPLLNHPRSGEVAITLARGTQNFLLHTALADSDPPYVIALYMDNDARPSLAAIANRDLQEPIAASQAATAMGMNGEPVANQSALSITRGGYRVSLVHAAFPLTTRWVDTIGPWLLQPDNIGDSVGAVTIHVEPSVSRSSPGD
jgi:hypothetical protein